MRACKKELLSRQVWVTSCSLARQQLGFVGNNFSTFSSLSLLASFYPRRRALTTHSSSSFVPESLFCELLQSPILGSFCISKFSTATLLWMWRQQTASLYVVFYIDSELCGGRVRWTRDRRMMIRRGEKKSNNTQRKFPTIFSPFSDTLRFSGILPIFLFISISLRASSSRFEQFNAFYNSFILRPFLAGSFSSLFFILNLFNSFRSLLFLFLRRADGMRESALRFWMRNNESTLCNFY